MEPAAAPETQTEPVVAEAPAGAQHEESKTIADYKSILYKTSNSTVGSTAHMLQHKGPFCRSSHFSNSLAKAGNYSNNGLQTVVYAERYHDNTRDWMGKNN